MASAIGKETIKDMVSRYGQRFEFADVLVATRAVMLADGWHDASQAIHKVAKHIGFDTGNRDNYIGRVSAWDAIGSQIRRALDKLAEAGELVKRGRNEAGPGGSNAGRGSSRYWTPQKYAEAEREELARRQNAQVVADAWSEVHDALESRGLLPLGERGDRAKLSLTDWRKLLGLSLTEAERDAQNAQMAAEGFVPAGDGQYKRAPAHLVDEFGTDLGEIVEVSGKDCADPELFAYDVYTRGR